MAPISASVGSSATASGKSESGSIYGGPFNTGDFIVGSPATGFLKTAGLPLVAAGALVLLWMIHKKK
jgi:hypothetical protein